MTAHVTMEQHLALDKRVDRNGERLDELQASQAATEANVAGVKEQLATLGKDQREDFKEVHSRINKQGRYQMGVLITSLLTLISFLGVVIVALIKLNGQGG